MAITEDNKAISAIMGASGITEDQARTCLYYTIATYFLPDELELIPILAIIGPHGTGKTDLLMQLIKMVNGPRLIGARTFPTLRDEFGKTTTALLDDADDITEANEKILIHRYSKIGSVIGHKVDISPRIDVTKWRDKKTDVFGATIITKRTPFKDSAVTSRSIIIKTKYVRGKYKIKGFRNAHEVLSKIAKKIDLEDMGKPTSQRTKNNWMPLQAVARYFKDEEWLDYSEKEIKGSTRVLKVGQSYEPEEALLRVLKEKMKEAMTSTGTLFYKTVLLSTMKDDLWKQFDVRLTNIQIHEILSELGFKVVSHSGYPKVKFDDMLQKNY
ncbi:MAG: hypothetical protein ACYSR0_11630 [Planctomycetota bacterium]|jgi:hypothetical protein